MLRRLPARLAAVVLLAGALAPGGEAPSPVTPWPHGAAPSAAELDRLLDDAKTIEERERFEEFLAASEINEDSDHLPITQEDVDADVYDKKILFQFGDEFFSHQFTHANGYGDGSFKTMKRVHTGVRGGLDTFSCAGCHSLGGPDGAGSPTENAMIQGDGDHADSALVRNAPAMLGVGMVQALGAEMSHELQFERQTALDQAKSTGKAVSLALTTKGISFGALVVQPDATIDYSALDGVDFDLVIKPFGRKGTISRLRRFVEDAARLHFGEQSHILALGYQKKPDVPHLGPGPNWYDPDNDGRQRELEEGILTTVASYLAMLEVPVVLPPADPGLRDRWANGSALFDSVGCSSCHVRQVPLLYTLWHETSDTTAGEVVINLFTDGDEPRGTNLVEVFSDFKRHDLGPGLADPHDEEHKLPRSVFLTRPLWGLAETPPYLHDGRAPTIPDAILAHGGDAQPERDAFAALPPDDQADLHLFLLSLTREPKVRVAR
ncbi:MAG: di-heme oxidoredictase family protein [Byssovorax sp.]